MNCPRWSFLVVFALSCAPSTLAWADEASLKAQVQTRVEDGLLKPLAAQEASTSRFSRARLPPHERRVRALASTASSDKAGRPFVAFAVDVRFGSAEWHENDIVGCAYLQSGDVFVKRDDGYRPAAFLLGKDVPVTPNACVAAPPPPPPSRS